MWSHDGIDELQTKRNKNIRNIFLDFLSVFEITIIHFSFITKTLSNRKQKIYPGNQTGDMTDNRLARLHTQILFFPTFIPIKSLSYINTIIKIIYLRDIMLVIRRLSKSLKNLQPIKIPTKPHTSSDLWQRLGIETKSFTRLHYLYSTWTSKSHKMAHNKFLLQKTKVNQQLSKVSCSCTIEILVTKSKWKAQDQ